MQARTPEETPADEPRTPEGYRTTPDQENTGWPPGVPYIIGNEVCERFSFYGMRAILKIHLASLFVLTIAVQQQAVQVVAEKKLYYAIPTATSASANADPVTPLIVTTVNAGLYVKQLDASAADAANSSTHLFFASVYAFAMIGALVADRLLGKYKTILYLSLVYCAGHAVLSMFENSLTGMFVGLALIAIGSGGIKPCVSANVGDQFGKNNWHRIKAIFQAFYFSINLGSALATLFIPVTKAAFGTSVAFAIPGVLMFVATLLFWMGRNKFVHVPAKPGGKIGWLDTLSSISLFMAFGHFIVSPSLVKEVDVWVQVATYTVLTLGFLALGLYLFNRRQQLQPDDGFLAITLHAVRAWFRREPGQSPAGADHPLAQSRFWAPAVERYGPQATEGPVAVFKIISVFILVSIFWALFDQKATTWVDQAKKMDRTLWGEVTIKAEQTIAANPFLVMALIPLINLAYAGLARAGIKLSALQKMAAGMIVTALSFVAVALIQAQIDELGPDVVSIWWQMIPYILLTTGEVMVSVTGLEFAYTQAPKRMKSTVMGFFMLTVTLGNVLALFLVGIKELSLENRFLVCAGLMAGAGLLFGLRAAFYTPRDYTQG